MMILKHSASGEVTKMSSAGGADFVPNFNLAPNF